MSVCLYYTGATLLWYFFHSLSVASVLDTGVVLAMYHSGLVRNRLIYACCNAYLSTDLFTCVNV